MNNPDSLICAIRESFYGAEIVYVSGSCYNLYKILSVVYSDAEPYYYGGHVITKINDKFYDISGEVNDELSCYIPYDKKAHKLKRRFVELERDCPNCDEPVRISLTDIVGN